MTLKEYLKLSLIGIGLSLGWNAQAQCVTINSASIALTSSNGTTCNYSITPNVTVSASGTQPKLLQLTFSSGGVTQYVCYTSPDGTNVTVAVKTTACTSVNEKLPRQTSATYPTANFSLPCGAASGNTYDGFAGASAGGGTGECTNPGVTPVPLTYTSLPVTFANFEANRVAEGVQLNWITTEELQNKLFEVQRSHDAIHFETIASIAGAGTSLEKNFYQYTDIKAGEGNVYYRIRQTDFSGAFSYSSMVAVGKEEVSMSVGVFPNPIIATDFSVRGVGITGIETCWLSDLQGNLTRVNFTAEAGELKIQMPAKRLSPGTYVLQVYTTTGKLTRKVIIQ